MDPQTHLACALACPGEDESWLPPGWMKGSEIDGESRASLVDWLVQVSTYLGLSDNSLHLAVSHLDLVVSKVEVEVEEVQLMALACLLVAAKWVEDLAPAPGLLLPLMGGLGSTQDLGRLEREVVVSLAWDLDRTTPSTFLHYAAQALPKDKQVFRGARAVLDFCLLQPWYGTLQPSKLAAACLLAATCLQGKEWSQEMTARLEHHPATLLGILPRLLEALLSGQGVREGAGDKHAKSIRKLGHLDKERIEGIVDSAKEQYLRAHEDSRESG